MQQYQGQTFDGLPTLPQDQDLTSDQSLTVMQQDGNLVIYDKNQEASWASGSVDQGTAPFRLLLQADGNLVIYDSDNNATWASGTNGKGEAPFKLTMQGDGNLVIYDKNDQATWASQTGVMI